MMKKLFFVFLALWLALGAAAQPLTLWQLKREGDSKTYKVQVPCTVAGALDEAGVFGADVRDQMRYRSIDRAMFETPWVFSTRFDAAKGLRHVLRFDGLGYSADIRLNGTLIASADTTVGFYCVREFDITSLAKKKGNRLEVTVHRAPAACLNSGYADWNPRPVDESMGIVRKVELISTPDVEIQEVYVKPEVNPDNLDKAAFVATVTLINRSEKPVTGALEGVYDGGSFSRKVSLAPGESKDVAVRQEVMHPRIWWSHDMGRPELYNLNVTFGAAPSKSIRFGLRSVTSEIDEKGHLQLFLNGKPVLLKAAGWTDDIFMTDTPERTRAQLLFVKDMGLNGVRFENIWGRDDTVYDLCDELGLLSIVGWSCQWEWEDYCGLPETKHWGCISGQPWEDLAARYFHDQVIRLRNHPSIMAWLTGSDRIPAPTLEERYLAMYKQLDYRPYVCSAKGLTSLAGPSGVKMEGPYEYVGPDYWYRDTERGGAYGFNTETGIGLNIPQKESVRRMVGEENLWPLGEAWNYHCTVSAHNMNSTAVLEKVMEAEYGAPKDLDDFMKKAHALDYDGTRAMFEAFRCRLPETTGIVQWMLNSAWPSLYWQLFDYYLVPTASYYGTKKACLPYQLIYDYKKHTVYAVNEVAKDTRMDATMLVFGPDGKFLRREDNRVSLHPREPRKAFKNIEGPCFIALSLTDKYGHRVADNFYAIPAGENNYNWKKGNWCTTPIREYVDMSFVSDLPQATLTMKTKPTDSGFDVTLTNVSDVVAYQNILKAKDSRDELVPAVIWSDNFFSLAPGESRRVSCRIPEKERAVISHEGWNGVISLAPDSLDRNRSKYATYNFSADDQYTTLDTYETVTVAQPKGKKVKNIIFMIGDGMGFEQVSCGWVINGGALNMDQMPYTGVSRTWCIDRLVTDSCAGGAALAGGEKTLYGNIGLSRDGKPLHTTLQMCQERGMKTGIVVTCRLNDATPADFCNHAEARKEEEYLAGQYTESGVDLITGGGLHFWTDRTDGRNIVDEMVAKGYTFVDRLEDVPGAKGDKLVGIFGEYDLDPVTVRGPVLGVCTAKALEMLDNKNGFFLMVEGSQIDDWCHRHKLGAVMEELFDFDRVIGDVLKWAEKDGETLVIVTADHATGGLTLLKGSLDDRLVKVHFSTEGHNGIFVPVFAYGPQAERFVGMHENSEIGQIVKDIIKSMK